MCHVFIFYLAFTNTVSDYMMKWSYGNHMFHALMQIRGTNPTAETKVEVILKTFEMSNVHSSEVSSYRNEWARAIITNNATKASDILTNPHRPSTKFNLLQTQLPLSSPVDTHWKSTRVISILPFHLAVISHAMDVVRCLAQHGVDVTD